ncbi:MAG: phosphoglycerate mutase family protein [Lysobacterales bacterium]|jgi:broad specificity phosphatase PhoE
MRLLQNRLLLAACACCIFLFGTPPLHADSTATIFLVRHAEKELAGNGQTGQMLGESDPALSPAGQERAAELSRILRDAGIQRILSTDYLRTRETASPLASLLKLDIETYSPDRLEELVEPLKSGGQRTLVVGHSDTVPQLVVLLGGDPGSDIDEAGEYDRLYVVETNKGGEVTTILLRYGAPYRP